MAEVPISLPSLLHFPGTIPCAMSSRSNVLLLATTMSGLQDEPAQVAALRAPQVSIHSGTEHALPAPQSPVILTPQWSFLFAISWPHHAVNAALWLAAILGKTPRRQGPQFKLVEASLQHLLPVLLGLRQALPVGQK